MLSNLEMTVGNVFRGDDFCCENGIEHIDFLKMDVEGAEFKVLAGLDRMLSDQRVDIIQFEYGLKSVVTRFLLKDYYELFTSRGYVVGKLYPNGVYFKDYHVTDEDFMGPNYVAVLNRARTFWLKLSAIGRSDIDYWVYPHAVPSNSIN